MRIEQVRAHSFGPLMEQQLTLAPGMTVLCGDNESAKSSWHAAVYAALCGRRRSKGRPTKEDARFAELHQPWDRPDQWRVSCTIALEAGRRIELRHDLAGMVDCSATDLETGRDVSDEVMFDGSPDGSRWLGLDRKSFAATATVNQAELLAVLQAANGLQEHIQRAAANAHSDSTAAQALDALLLFQREHVGLDRANSTKPLRRTQTAYEMALRRLDGARTMHDAYLIQVVQVRERRDEAQAAAQDLARAEKRVVAAEERLELARAAAVTGGAAERAAERTENLAEEYGRQDRTLERIRTLNAEFNGTPPPDESASDALAAHVAQALADWRALPVLTRQSGPTAAELETRLGQLPTAPEGDTEVHSTVAAAEREYDRAAALLAEHLGQSPEAGQVADAESMSRLAVATEVGSRRLRELAHLLDISRPQERPELDQALAAAEELRANAASALEQAQERLGLARQRFRDAESELASARTRAMAGEQAAALARQSRDGQARAARTAAIVVAVAAAVTAAGMGILGQFAGSLALGGLSLAATVVAALAARIPHPKVVASEKPEADDNVQAAEKRFAQQSQELAAREADHDQSGSRLAAAERALAADRIAADEHRRTLEAAQAEVDKARAVCDELGIPDEPGLLGELAAAADQADLHAETAAQHRRRAAELEEIGTTARNRLCQALAFRGTADNDSSLPDLLTNYRHQCAENAQQAAEAITRDGLQAQLTARREHEAVVERATAQHMAAATTLHEAVSALGQAADRDAGAEPSTPEEAVRILTAWQQGHAADQHDLAGRRSRWSELTTLLDGCAVEKVDAVTARLRERHAAARSELDQAVAHDAEAKAQLRTGLAAANLDPGSSLEELTKSRDEAQAERNAARGRSTTATTRAAESEGAVQQQARQLPSVAEAEENLEVARRERGRVQELDRVLTLTQRYLHDAQDAVHRDIAPILNRSLNQWLPHVTGDRYRQAVVDPRELRVHVSGDGGALRSSELLSRGTAEQVYLLLRIALSRHLGAPDEPCPLLLDDVTVQSDADRTLHLLDLLHELSEDQQIVLFAQERFVADWAERNLTGPRHKVVRLPRVTGV